MDFINEADLAWCRNLFAMLVEGGTWAVPRSGLIFKKTAGEFVLIAAMPHEPAMPVTEKQLAEIQKTDYEQIKAKFYAAGIPVKDET